MSDDQVTDQIGPVSIDVVAPSDPDARFCIESYFAEIDRRFDGGFRQELSSSADYAEFSEPTGLLFVARSAGRPVGCGALKFHDLSHSDVPDIKRMWIAPESRGLGVGRRLLAAIEQAARQRGYPGVRLETNRSLTEAIAMYRKSGYVEVDPFNDEHYAHHWFEKRWD